ncbi:hypothetical protein EW145_g3297 [Phellinidium pouzarii]|uniref:Cytochrome P450 n=1 Tax=Phellinidium pouzarii TaxID=167371 RepID=A0A4S4L7U3_9AGAM|nr:hypothetical protein EW145_g3297 [Phellinidium pouzarii]
MINYMASTTVSQTYGVIVATVVFLYLYRRRFYGRNANAEGMELRDPPGPRGIPIFGNEFQIPKDKQWLKFDEWSQRYDTIPSLGNIVRITTMGQPIIILNSAQVALDILETRGNIYSDRPRAVMAGELVGWNRGLGYAQYGERFKDFRKMFHQTMGPRSLPDLRPLQEKENARLLLRLLEKPEAFIEHARQSTGATILKLAYGYTAKPESDPFVKIAEDAMAGFSKASEPGAFMVDRFPFLKCVPSWLPGANFHSDAKAMRDNRELLYDVPFNFVESEMASGHFVSSFTSRYLTEKQDPSESEKELVKAAAASLYSGGADTTPSSITSFILAMTLYPEVQARGQAEVDDFVGNKRLPNLADRDGLPYVNAIVKEILRWNPVVPLGLPHQVIQDDVYENYKIPKGTIVWANIWTILHDKNIFTEPFEFYPERFIESTGFTALKEGDRAIDPSYLAFGFGRSFALHIPSDSPSNPFGRFKPFIPRDLPRETPVSDHLILRFQLVSQAHSVHRIVSVPANYTFWHLSRLTQFLFGWKDERTERSGSSHVKVKRRVEHVFTVQKRATFYPNLNGLIKSGETVVRVAGNVKNLKLRIKDNITWEREECYMLRQLWHRLGSSTDVSRVVIYDYDALSSRKEIVHITISSESDKLRAMLQNPDDLGNTPFVIMGQGLPDDDDDDEDFALDLEQWNEPSAFENYILSQEEDEEDGDDDNPSASRLAEQQALIKRRMTAPLPKRLPVDDELGPEDDSEEELIPAAKGKTAKTAVLRAPVKKRTSMPLATRLPDPDETREVGVEYPSKQNVLVQAPAIALGHSPMKKCVARLPDPDESREIGVEYPAPRRRRFPGREEDQEESLEIDDRTEDEMPAKKSRMTLDTRAHALENKPAVLYRPVKQMPIRGGGRRVSSVQTNKNVYELVESETEL